MSWWMAVLKNSPPRLPLSPALEAKPFPATTPRLRRDAFRYAVIGPAAVLLTVSVVVLRSRRQKKGDEPATVTSLDDVAAQLEEIREELARRRKESGPLWQKLALRAATTAAAAGGAAVARRAMERLAGSDEPAHGTDPDSRA